MAKFRYLNTDFWTDPWVQTLTPMERYLFLYLLQNDHTSICGVYEISTTTIRNEAGITKEDFLKMIPHFEGRVYYIKGWIYIKNFIKHQANNKFVQKGIIDALAKIPAYIKEEIDKIGVLRCPEGTSGDLTGPRVTSGDLTGPEVTRDIECNMNVNVNGIEICAPAGARFPKPERELLDLPDPGQEESGLVTVITPERMVDPINQVFNVFHDEGGLPVKYKNKTQREDVEVLIRSYGLEEVLEMARLSVALLIGKRNNVEAAKYAPIINDPGQLRLKWGTLQAFKPFKEKVRGPGGGHI